MALMLGGRAGLRCVSEALEGHFGGVFAGLTDVLPVVPEAGGDDDALDFDGAGPGCAAS